MMIFIDIKRLVQLFFIFIGAIAIYMFYKTFGLSMVFIIVLGLAALKFAPAFLPVVLLLYFGLHFTGDFSFIADGIVTILWSIILIPMAIFTIDMSKSYFSKKEKPWYEK
ncbi:hypothetical protein HMPREF2619_02095 [Streptococcus sp. HMSC074B11]|jgi:hypothetical protein|uniref:hypothetical protein n=1 Tax=Streptococcus TaxID=1301 RepID=UPI0008A4CF15|nr:hypothetical protein [Streptococcus sp. HMSC074B11]OFO00375.1 hypothetical protein HMPREF2619_02095 [Streptococcus sp. HMSC074B11]HEU6349535.1 hypothetical protein [Streptococcus pneumoniae]